MTILVALGFTKANLAEDLEESYPWLTEDALDEIYQLIESTMPSESETNT
jgi:hypothetical protein